MQVDLPTCYDLGMYVGLPGGISQLFRVRCFRKLLLQFQP